jgi:hypothetical protein
VTLRFDTYRRLEPRRPLTDLGEGFRAAVHDAAWQLGRQWQVGEHQGEDASSPVTVRVRASRRPLDDYAGNPQHDPQLVPPEAIVESEPDDWWTPGRRVRIGLEVEAAVSLPDDPALKLADLPPPYDELDGRGYDGLTLYRLRQDLQLPDELFAEVPDPPPENLWRTDGLCYEAEFTVDGRTLTLPRHDGGDIDWYSVEAGAPLPPPSPTPPATAVFASALSYPGAPHPRWWQIEDARVDIGGFAPDRSHFATMLLIDLLVSHSDDWFTFPLAATPGTVLTLHEVSVRDSFDEDWQVTPPTDWSLFTVAGLDVSSLLLWPTVTTPLTGPPLEELTLGVDEDANLLWAVEQRVGGAEVRRETVPGPSPGPAETLDASAPMRYAYRPSTGVPASWHPYQRVDSGGRPRLRQARLAELSVDPPRLAPAPRAVLLRGPPGGGLHEIEPSAVPATGLRLERRYMLARATDGQPVLWLQRRRRGLAAPPSSGLRFDVLEQSPPTA